MVSAVTIPQLSSTLTAASLPSHQPPNPPPIPIPPSPDPPPLPQAASSIPDPLPKKNPLPQSTSSIPDPLPKKKWSALFATKPKNAGSFSPPEIVLQFDGENLVITEDIVQASVEQWQGYLVGFFLDSPLSYYAVVNKLRNLWKPQGTIDFKSNGSVFFFQFSSLADRIRVLEADPIIIRNKLFIVKPWEPSLSNVANCVRAVPVWIKMFNIPLAAWSKRGICWLATRVGKFLCMDINTESINRLEFAKCMVEVSSESALPDSFPVRLLDGSVQLVKVRYLWKPDLCIHCKVFGHQSEKCQNEKENIQVKSGKDVDNTQKNFMGNSNVETHKSARVNKVVNSARTGVPINKSYWTMVPRKKKAVKYVVSSKEKGKQVIVDVSPPDQRKTNHADVVGTSNMFSHLPSSLDEDSNTDDSYEVEDGEITPREKGNKGDAVNTNDSQTYTGTVSANEIEREKLVEIEGNIASVGTLEQNLLESDFDPMKQIISDVLSFQSALPSLADIQATQNGFVSLLKSVEGGREDSILVSKTTTDTAVASSIKKTPSSNSMIKPGFLNSSISKSSEREAGPVTNTQSVVPSSIAAKKKSTDKMNLYAHILPPAAYKPPPPIHVAASAVASTPTASFPGYHTRSNVQVVEKLFDND